MADDFNPGRERVQVTASPNIMTEQVRFDPQGSANRLIAALGADTTQRELANFNAQYEQKKLEDQKLKFDWYVEQFAADHAGGAVSQAQVKERFPETVPVIASRIAEAIGMREGRKQFQSAIDEVSGNDSLRLDSAARTAFLAQKRGEIVGSIGQGNDFYGAGVVAALDKLTAQHELNWQTETAGYHQKVQADQFSTEVVDILNSGNPKGLLELDAKYKASSSLNDLERKKLVVDSVIDLAFANDDPAMLAVVPTRFLNVDAKAALNKARGQLAERRMGDFRNAQYLKEVQREEQRRAMRLRIINDVAEGKTVNPGDYRSDPDAFTYAMQMREVSRVPADVSAGRAETMRRAILDGATTGEMPPLDSLIDRLVMDESLSPHDRQQLIGDLPKLIEGRNLMADDMVRQPVTDRLNPRLQALESSTNSVVQGLLTGRNLRAEVMKGYDLDIRRSFMAEFEETGRWPTGHRKLELIDRAVDRAEKLLEQATRIGSGGAGTAPNVSLPRSTGSGSNNSAPGGAGLPNGVTRLN